MQTLPARFIIPACPCVIEDTCLTLPRNILHGEQTLLAAFAHCEKGIPLARISNVAPASRVMRQKNTTKGGGIWACVRGKSPCFLSSKPSYQEKAERNRSNQLSSLVSLTSLACKLSTTSIRYTLLSCKYFSKSFFSLSEFDFLSTLTQALPLLS